MQYRNCRGCGKLFTAHGTPVRYCGDDCRRAGLRAYAQEWERINRPRPTAHYCECGADLKVTRNKCDACLVASKRQARKRAKRRRKALKRGIATEPYTLAEIAIRDKHRCGICGKRVAMSKAVPDPKAPTIDHIVPLDPSAGGGNDTRANVQLAHFECNWRKSNGYLGAQQLLLVG